MPEKSMETIDENFVFVDSSTGGLDIAVFPGSPAHTLTHHHDHIGNGTLPVVSHAAADEQTVVELNVGGRIFTTTLATLKFERDSKLARLFPDNCEQGSRRFLDHDPGARSTRMVQNIARANRRGTILTPT